MLYGATSCAVWWADVSGIERSTAREQLRVARAMADYDALDAALESGRLSYAKLKVISRLADADTVDELIELAEDCPAGHLGVLLAAWRRRREDDDTISAAQYDARKLTWRTETRRHGHIHIAGPPGRGRTVRDRGRHSRHV